MKETLIFVTVEVEESAYRRGSWKKHKLYRLFSPSVSIEETNH